MAVTTQYGWKVGFEDAGEAALWSQVAGPAGPVISQDATVAYKGSKSLKIVLTNSSGSTQDYVFTRNFTLGPEGTSTPGMPTIMRAVVRSSVAPAGLSYRIGDSGGAFSSNPSAGNWSFVKGYRTATTAGVLNIFFTATVPTGTTLTINLDYLRIEVDWAPTVTADSTPVNFTFEPDAYQTVTERIEYRTDVLTSQNEWERRVKLRERPLRGIAFLMSEMNARDASYLQSKLWDNYRGRWNVPLWWSARRVTGVSGAGGTWTLNIDTTGTEFVSGQRALVWADQYRSDLVTVQTVGAGSVTVSVTPSFTYTSGMVVAPSMVATIVSDSGVAHPSINIAQSTIEFEFDTVSSAVPAAVSETQFRSKWMLTIIPNINENADEWEQPVDSVGLLTGKRYIKPFTLTPLVKRSMTFMLNGYQEIADFRGFIMKRRGRYDGFWVPTYHNDLKLNAAIPASSFPIYIESVGYTARMFPDEARKNIVLIRNTGQMSPHRVSTASDNGSTETLMLETFTLFDITPDTMCSFLVWARLSEDAVSIVYHNFQLAEVTIQVQELPTEVSYI